MEKSKEGTSLLTIKISILYLIANLKNFAIKSYCIFYFYIVKLLNIDRNLSRAFEFLYGNTRKYRSSRYSLLSMVMQRMQL